MQASFEKFRRFRGGRGRHRFAERAIARALARVAAAWPEPPPPPAFSADPGGTVIRHAKFSGIPSKFRFRTKFHGFCLKPDKPESREIAEVSVFSEKFSKHFQIFWIL